MAALTPDRRASSFGELFQLLERSGTLSYENESGQTVTVGSGQPAFEYQDGEFQGLKLLRVSGQSGNPALYFRNSPLWVNELDGHLVTRYFGVEGDDNIRILFSSEEDNGPDDSKEIVAGWKTYVLKWSQLNLSKVNGTRFALLGRWDGGDSRYSKGAYISVQSADEDRDIFDMEDFNSLMNSEVW